MESQSPLSAYQTPVAPVGSRLPQPLVYLLLTLIIALLVAGSLSWVRQNITLVGRDAAGHLERSVVAADALATPGVRGFFTALTLTDDYRPPLLYLLSVPFYRIFGPGMDSAQFLNVALLAVLLALTFPLARPLLGDGWALVAVLLTGLLPMIASMSRLYYMENLLTALLLLTILALLRSQGFHQRGWSLLWGISLGLALLTKWTAPIYLALPVLYVLWRAGWNLPVGTPQAVGLVVWPRAPTAIASMLRRSLTHWRRWGMALLIALVLVALWWWPNRALADEFLLGPWLPLLWFVLWSVTIYSLLLPPAPWTNLVSATLLAASIASLWYFPQIDFTSRLSDVAFGTDRGTQAALDLTRLSNYTRYFGYWFSHHMGLLATLIIVPAALGGWLLRWRLGAQASAQTTISAAPPVIAPATVYWLLLLSGYLCLALIAQANPRNLNVLLPFIAILLVAGVRTYPRPVAVGLAALWIGVLGLQWSIYTFDRFAPLYDRTPALWVHGDYLAWPATGSSDPGFWIQPDVLATIGNPPDEPASFGMLSDAWELHRGSFRYLISAEHRNIDLMALTESDSRGWSDLLANQWVLVKTGDNSTVKPAGQQVIARVLGGDPLFHLLYAEVKRYALPNGEEAILYHRAAGPAHPYEYPVVLIETQPLAETLNRFWRTGATLYVGNPDTATWVGIHDLKADRIVMPAAGDSVASVLAGVHGTIFALTRYDTAEVQDWLFANGYAAVEVGDHEFHLTIVGRPDQPLASLPPQSRWTDVEITDVRSLATTHAGAVLPVELSATGLVDGTRKLSLRLVDAGGTVVAQQDRTVEPAFRYGLLIPPDAPPGEYSLAGILYDPATVEPIPDTTGNELATLATITVDPTP
jgi:hypothetical protein